MKAANLELDVVIVNNFQELAQETLEIFTSDARKAIQTRGRFCIALSRHTPRPFFELLAAEPRSKALPWDKIHLFGVDQYCGSPDFTNNSYNSTVRSFIPNVHIPAENVHRICSACRNCRYVASTYEQTIYDVVHSKKNGIPRFDLIILAMSADGHIASLFPDTYAFFELENLVCVIYFMDSRQTRITLTHPILCAASHIAVLVSGERKAATLREVLTAEPDEVQYPIHAIWPILDKVTWVVDRSAAKFLLPRHLPNKLGRFAVYRASKASKHRPNRAYSGP